MKELIGKKVTGLRVSQGESELVFETNYGSIWYQVDGDCCSESWFADITGVPALLGAVVIAADEVPLEAYNVNDGRSRQEEDSAYGYKLTTTNGYVDIVFRNSSNGYYGGWMTLGAGDPPKNTRAITGDWQA